MKRELILELEKIISELKEEILLKEEELDKLISLNE